MGRSTNISWATSTQNFWIGCQGVSAACDNCYAESFAIARLGLKWGPGSTRSRVADATFRAPLDWNRRQVIIMAKWREAVDNLESLMPGMTQQEPRPSRPPPWVVFTMSLGDFFDNAVPAEWRDEAWRIIAQTSALRWMILTKRPENIRKMPPPKEAEALAGAPWPWPWVALGTTIETQAVAARRVGHLFAVPAAHYFASCEPLLGSVNLRELWVPMAGGGESLYDALGGAQRFGLVITGGEQAKDARFMHPEWEASLRRQCAETATPYHFKQWGTWGPHKLQGAPVQLAHRGGGAITGKAARAAVVRLRRGQSYEGPADDGGTVSVTPGDTGWRALWRGGVGQTGYDVDGVRFREHIRGW